MKAEFIPVKDLHPGHRIGGGTVVSVRFSASGKTIFVTYERRDGSQGTYSQSTVTKAAIFTD